MKNLNEGLSPEESEKAKIIFKSIINDKRDELFKKYGNDAEKVAYGHAIKKAKQQVEKVIAEIEDETAPYDSNIPMRPLTKEERAQIIKRVLDFKQKNKYFDPEQDFAFEYISGTQYHHITAVGNLDNQSENSLWNIKIPEDAWPGKIIGNMNYTDAYKEEEKAHKQSRGLYEDDIIREITNNIISKYRR